MQELPLEAYVKQTLTVFCETKTMYCAQHQARTDLQQTVDCLVNGKRGIGIIPDKAFIEAAVRSMEEAQGHKARRIVHLADGYGYAIPPGAPTPRRRPRDAFAAGDPNAFECLSACGIHVPTGKVAFFTVRYSYDEYWPQFDEIEPGSDHELHGDIPRLLREVAK